MSDILFGDDLKKEIRALMWILKRRLKKQYNTTIEQVRNDMDNCGNPVIAKIWNEIVESAEKIEETYQKDIATEFPMIILWIIYKDTAYSPIFFYIITKLLEDPKLYEQAKKFSVEPEDWYVNRWHKTKEHTAELKAKGELPDFDGAMAGDEKIFTPPLQEIEYQKINKELNDRKKQMIKRK